MLEQRLYLTAYAAAYTSPFASTYAVAHAAANDTSAVAATNTITNHGVQQWARVGWHGLRGLWYDMWRELSPSALLLWFLLFVSRSTHTKH